MVLDIIGIGLMSFGGLVFIMAFLNGKILKIEWPVYWGAVCSFALGAFFRLAI